MGRKKRALSTEETTLTSAQCDCSTSSETNQGNAPKGLKSRAYFGELYPESVPDWEERLKNAGTRILAIRHNKDTNPDGEDKKEHVHVIQIWDGPVRYSQGNESLLKLGCIKAPVDVRVVHSLATCSRYLLHLDNPEKYQYERNEILEFGGADWDEYASRTCDREKVIVEMEKYCDENAIVSFRQLCQYARENEPTWHKSLTTTSGWFMKEYLKSSYWERTNMEVYEDEGDN